MFIFKTCFKYYLNLNNFLLNANLKTKKDKE